VEAAHHRGAEHGVRECHQTHTLMVGKVGSHAVNPGRDGRRLLFGYGSLARRVVESFDEPESARGVFASEAAEVGRGRGGVDESREGRRVRSDDEVLGEPALESEAGNAEGLVPVVPVLIHHVVRRFRNAPWHMVAPAVENLRPHYRAAAALEQGLGVAAQHQQRHQVFEHRAAPGHQRGRALDIHQGAREPEPMLLRNVAARDGDEARKSRFGCQQVVVRGIEPSRPLGVRQTKPDRERAADAVVQESPLHAVGERVAATGQIVEPCAHIGGRRPVSGRE